MEKPKSPTSLSKAFFDACAEIALASKRHGAGQKGVEYFLADGSLHSEMHAVSGRKVLVGTINLGSLHPQEEIAHAQRVRRSGPPEEAPRFLVQLLTAVAYLLDLNQDAAVLAAIQTLEQSTF